VPELAALFVEHLEQFRMRVAERGHGDAAGEVDVIAPGGVPHARAFARSGTNGAGEKHGTITSSKVWRLTVWSFMANPCGLESGADSGSRSGSCRARRD
jgi:hypothetical protein